MRFNIIFAVSLLFSLAGILGVAFGIVGLIGNTPLGELAGLIIVLFSIAVMIVGLHGMGLL